MSSGSGEVDHRHDENRTSDKGMSKKDRLRALLAKEILKDIDKYPRGYRAAPRGPVSGRAMKLVDERMINSGVSRGSAAGNRRKHPIVTKMPVTLRPTQSAVPRARQSALAGRGAGISVPVAHAPRPSTAAFARPVKMASRGVSAGSSRAPTPSQAGGSRQNDTRFVDNRSTPFMEDRYLNRTAKVDEWGAIQRLDHLRHQEDMQYERAVAKQQQQFNKRMLDLQMREKNSIRAARQEELDRDKDFIQRSVIALAREDNERKEHRRREAEKFFAVQMEQIKSGQEKRERDAAEEYARGQEELKEAAEALAKDEERRDLARQKKAAEMAAAQADNAVQISRKKQVLEEEKLLEVELQRQYVAKLEAEEERRRRARAELEAKMNVIEGAGEGVMARKLKLMKLREEKADRDHAELERRTAEAEMRKVEAARQRDLDNVETLKRMEEYQRELARQEKEREFREAEEVLRLAREGLRMEQEQREARRARAVEASKDIKAQMADDAVRKGYDDVFMTPREREINLGLLHTVKREVPKLWSQVDSQHVEREAIVARHQELISKGRQF